MLCLSLIFYLSSFFRLAFIDHQLGYAANNNNNNLYIIHFYWIFFYHTSLLRRLRIPHDKNLKLDLSLTRFYIFMAPIFTYGKIILWEFLNKERPISLVFSWCLFVLPTFTFSLECIYLRHVILWIIVVKSYTKINTRIQGFVKQNLMYVFVSKNI